MSRTSYPFNFRVFLGGIGVLVFLMLTGLSGYTAPALTSKEIDKAAKAKIQEAYGRLPLYFIQNDGQVDGNVKFYEKGSGHATFFTKEGVYLLLTRGQKTLQTTGGQAEDRMQSPQATRRGGNKEYRQTINQGQNQKAQPVIANDQRKRGNLKSEIARSSKSETHSASLVLDSSGGESAEVDNSKLITNQPINSINELNSQLIKLIPVGANKDPEIVAEGQQAGKVNYFRGNDPEKWRADIPTYRAVVYKEIYPGIDMKFYGSNRELEYDIIVSPGADPSIVRLSYEGIESLKVTETGDLEIGLEACSEQGNCKILQRKPHIYQEIDGKRVVIEGKFKVFASVLTLRDSPRRTSHLRKKDVIASDQRERGNLKDEIASPSARNDRNEKFKVENENLKLEYGFELASYDKAHPIIIDPVLVYSTYLGGSDYDRVYDIAVDNSGNVYLTGYTWSTDFPTRNPIQPNLGGWFVTDAFVTKINPAGDALVLKQARFLYNQLSARS